MKGGIIITKKGSDLKSKPPMTLIKKDTDKAIDQHNMKNFPKHPVDPNPFKMKVVGEMSESGDSVFTSSQAKDGHHDGVGD